MTASDTRNPQQLAVAADAFVDALGALFPSGTFAQFFHGETIRRAYWAALQVALESYTPQEGSDLPADLIGGQVLTHPHVVSELLKLFLPGEAPDYAAVAEDWAASMALPPEQRPSLTRAARALFGLVGGELRRSAELRLALEQAAEQRATHESRPVLAAEEDLSRLLDAALVDGPEALSRQVRHLLELSQMQGGLAQPPANARMLALAGLADHLDVDMVRRLWAFAAQLDEPDVRLQAISRLAPRASRLGLVRDSLTPVEELLREPGDLPDPALSVDVLLTMTPRLETPNLDEILAPLQQRLLDGIRSISDPASQVRALSETIEKFSPQLQHEAVSLAFETASCCIPNELARALALSDLPRHLPPQFHSRLLDLALEVEAPDARAHLLRRMLPHLSEAFRQPALTAALDAIGQISGDDARADELVALAPRLEAIGWLSHYPERLLQALQVVFSITREDAWAMAFTALAPFLSQELLEESLIVIKKIVDDEARSHALIRLAPHLPDQLSVAAFTLALEIQAYEPRARALSAVASYLSASARARALADALAAALAIERRYDRVAALVDLAPHLPDDLQRRALTEALTAARSIPDEGERGRALVFLTPHLPVDRLADALADAYTITDLRERVPVLSALMPYLPEEPRLRVAQDVLDVAAGADAAEQATILAAICPVLPDELVQPVIDAVMQIASPYERMHVLTALLRSHPERLRAAAVESARAVPDPARRANALLEVVPYVTPTLRYILLEEALKAALAVTDDYDRASAFSHLAPYLNSQIEVQNRQQDALSLALDACFTVADPGQRARLLGQIAAEAARLLTPAQSYTLWRQAVNRLRTQPAAEVVTSLAALVPILEQMEGVGAIGVVAEAIQRRRGQPPA
ncbi:MAG: hypothetical protein GXY36_10795 [Chloroflexi bacterium]|nr:hypothetical protein [Chloroflexota bacterium]